MTLHTRETLASLLRAEIEQRGLTQQQAGELASMLPPHVSMALGNMSSRWDSLRVRLATALFGARWQKVQRFTPHETD